MPFVLGAERFTLISGQDYPTRSVDALMAALNTDQDIIAVDRECPARGAKLVDHCAFDWFFGDHEILSLREGSLLLKKLVGRITSRLPRRRSPSRSLTGRCGGA